jgi:excisionase family DNA binding protein
MLPSGRVSVAEAATRLAVSPQRIRAMIQAGQLEASKVGDVWLVSLESIARRRRAEPPAGRRYLPENAWALLLNASGEPNLRRRAQDLIRPSERRHPLVPASYDNIVSLAPRLRSRAVSQRFRAHPGDLARLTSEPGVVRTGVSAADELDFDIAATGVFEAYVAGKRLPTLQKKYLLEPSPTPNVILHVVDGTWPFEPGRTIAPQLIASLDLLDSDDDRTRRAALKYFKERKA